MKILKLCVLFPAICVLLQSCMICFENEKTLKKALHYTNQIPLTVDNLKNMLYQDTSHYKVVIVYSPCCGPCIEHMKRTYKQAMMACDSTVKFYFVLDDCGGVKYNEAFLKKYQIDIDKMYYLRDTTSLFNLKNINRFNNMANYIFPSEQRISGLFGIPLNLIVSKDNKLKKATCSFIRDNTDSIRYTTTSLHQLETYDFHKIDFDLIEDKDFIQYNFCTPEGCK